MLFFRLENRDTRHYKFLQFMQGKLKDCVPPILISAHQFTSASHHQDAARKYLEAYKLLPENPLINLCVGISLSLVRFEAKYWYILFFHLVI